MKAKIIKCDGTEKDIEGSFADIEKAIDARILDSVNLRNGKIMLVDDMGHVECRKQVNPKATKLYHSVCRPGTIHQIVGDVAVIKGN